MKKAAAAISGWDCPLLTFMYPGFDCGSLDFSVIGELHPLKDHRCLRASRFWARGSALRSARLIGAPGCGLSAPHRWTRSPSRWSWSRAPQPRCLTSVVPRPVVLSWQRQRPLRRTAEKRGQTAGESLFSADLSVPILPFGHFWTNLKWACWWCLRRKKGARSYLQGVRKGEQKGSRHAARSNMFNGKLPRTYPSKSNQQKGGGTWEGKMWRAQTKKIHREPKNSRRSSPMKRKTGREQSRVSRRFGASLNNAPGTRNGFLGFPQSCEPPLGRRPIPHKLGFPKRVRANFIANDYQNKPVNMARTAWIGPPNIKGMCTCP